MQDRVRLSVGRFGWKRWTTWGVSGVSKSSNDKTDWEDHRNGRNLALVRATCAIVRGAPKNEAGRLVVQHKADP